MGLGVAPSQGLSSSSILIPFLAAGGVCALLVILLLVMGPSTPPLSTRMRGCALVGGLLGVALMLLPSVNKTLSFLLYLVLGGRFSTVL